MRTAVIFALLVALSGTAAADVLRPRPLPQHGTAFHERRLSPGVAAPSVKHAPRRHERPLHSAARDLTPQERAAFLSSVYRCWNAGSQDDEATSSSVTVGFSLSPEGRPVSGSIRMVSHSSGSEDAARQAFEVARGAILRCGARGYELPADRYEEWRQMEIMFNPEKMRIK